METFSIRRGGKEDLPDIWRLVHELAIFERAPEQHTASIAEMEEDAFGKHPIYWFYVAEVQGRIVGMALCYYRYSTWKGRCMYLEDFYVEEAYRSLGIGVALFKRVIEQAQEEKCKRVCWQVLEWNEVGLRFYRRFNSNLDPEWVNGIIEEKDFEDCLKV